MRTIVTRKPTDLGMSVRAALPFLYNTKDGAKLALTVPDVHEAAHCREGKNCTGPGCNVNTRSHR